MKDELIHAAKAVLEWWPEGSETNSPQGKAMGDAFAADIRALRTAVAAAEKQP